MGVLLQVFTQRAEELAAKLTALDHGDVASFVFLGETYTSAHRTTLDDIYTFHLLQAAREAILAGAQAHTIMGRTFQKAQLSEINNELHRMEVRLARATRAGPRVRHVVPIA